MPRCWQIAYLACCGAAQVQGSNFIVVEVKVCVRSVEVKLKVYKVLNLKVNHNLENVCTFIRDWLYDK